MIVDAVHAKPEERDALAALAAELGVPFTGLWLEAPPKIMRDRVAARSGRRLGRDARGGRRSARLRHRTAEFRGDRRKPPARQGRCRLPRAHRRQAGSPLNSCFANRSLADSRAGAGCVDLARLGEVFRRLLTSPCGGRDVAFCGSAQAPRVLRAGAARDAGLRSALACFAAPLFLIAKLGLGLPAAAPATTARRSASA